MINTEHHSTKRIISRVLFRSRKDGDDHSSGADVTICLMRPNPEASGEPPVSPQWSTVGPCGKASLFGLAPGGVYQASDVTTGTGALLPHRFTLTRKHRAATLPFCTLAWRFLFCGTFLRVAPTGRYPAPCSMEPGLSSPRCRRGAIISSSSSCDFSSGQSNNERQCGQVNSLVCIRISEISCGCTLR